MDMPMPKGKKSGAELTIVIAGSGKPAGEHMCPTCGQPMPDDESIETMPDNESAEGEDAVGLDQMRRMLSGRR